jgi:hypothetical protein
MVIVCLLSLVEDQGEDGFGCAVDQGRAAAGAVEDLPVLEDRESSLYQGAGGVVHVVVLGLLLGQAAVFERDDHAFAGSGVGLVGEQLHLRSAGEAEEVVGAGAGQVVGGASVTGAQPQQVPVVIGQAGEGDRVVAVLVALIPVDVFALRRRSLTRSISQQVPSTRSHRRPREAAAHSAAWSVGARAGSRATTSRR